MIVGSDIQNANSYAMTTQSQIFESTLIMRCDPCKWCGSIVYTVPSAPVGRLSSNERAHCTEVSFMSQEVSLFFALGPESDSVGEGVHCLAVAADEGAAEVDVFYLVFFGLEVGDLADVVAGRVRLCAGREKERKGGT